MLIVVIGESGAGKTTLAHHLADKYGFRLDLRLPAKPVPEDELVVVDWNGTTPVPVHRPRPWARPVASGATTLDNLPIMVGPIGAGRDLVGTVDLLGGIVIEVSRKRLSGIGVVLPSGARGVDDGRLVRTADRFMEILNVVPADRRTPKRFGATALLGKAELAAVLAMLGKPVTKRRSPALRRAIAELGRAAATIDPRNAAR
jgi:hypothetical protein